jgi:hypothetical protein
MGALVLDERVGVAAGGGDGDRIHRRRPVVGDLELAAQRVVGADGEDHELRSLRSALERAAQASERPGIVAVSLDADAVPERDTAADRLGGGSGSSTTPRPG